MIAKVVIDTIILVSALLSSNDEAATVRVFDLPFKGNIIPIVTNDILMEYGDVLRRRKFHFPEECVSALLEDIARRSICVVPRHADLELSDEKDRPFLEAMFADDDIILVTGNMKHFPDHERIMTARDLIDRMTEC